MCRVNTKTLEDRLQHKRGLCLCRSGGGVRGPDEYGQILQRAVCSVPRQKAHAARLCWCIFVIIFSPQSHPPPPTRPRKNRAEEGTISLTPADEHQSRRRPYQYQGCT